MKRPTCIGIGLLAIALGLPAGAAGAGTVDEGLDPAIEASLAVSSGASTGPSEPSRWLAPGASAAVAAAEARVAGARAAVADGSFLALIQGITGARTAPANEMAPAPSTDTPLDARAAIAALDTAVRAASRLIGPLPADDFEDALQAVVRETQRSAHAHEPSEAQSVHVASPSIRRAAQAAPEATLLLAGALDRVLPSLRQTAETYREAGGTATGCDLVDQLPNLCVGSAADNEYTQDAALLIDLGGADTYRNSAGGAPLHVLGGLTYEPVSVNIDLGVGNDRYLPWRQIPSPAIAGVIGNGAGVFGGVGVLIDEGGDDIYSAAPEPVPAGGAPQTTAIVQGAGLGGVGMLVDRGGNDRYLVGAGASFALAQGAGLFCAGNTGTDLPHDLAGCPSGTLVDLGMGDDRYEIRPGAAQRGESRSVLGQAYGNAGTGVVLDDGGNDAFLMATTSRPTMRPGAPAETDVPSTQAISGQGYAAVGSVGLLLTGTGATTYDVEMRSDGRAFNRAWVQGAGVGENVIAVIDDLGGHDRYSVRTDLLDRREPVVDDDCACSHAERLIEAQPSGILYDNEIFGQGVGYQRATGMIHDHGGNDLYTAEGEHHLIASLHDRLDAPTRPPRFEVRSYGSPRVRAQGAASEGYGVLLDDAGTDTYTLRAINETRAQADSQHAPGKPEVTVLSRAPLAVFGQGGGAAGVTPTVGALLDLGGAGDRFETVVASPASSSSGPDGVFEEGGAWPWVHGSFGGSFVALGTNPTIVSRPSRPVCRTSAGKRGFGSWTDCVATSFDPETQAEWSIPLWTHNSTGLAPHASGRASTFEFLPETATSGTLSIQNVDEPLSLATPRLPVAVRLRDPDGIPVAGAPVRLSLQFGCHLLCVLGLPSEPLGSYWGNLWETVVVTDIDGVARSRLPLRTPPYLWNAMYQARLLATFEGGTGLYPVRQTQAVALTSPSA